MRHLALLFACVGWSVTAFAAVRTVDRAAYDPTCEVKILDHPRGLRAEWSAGKAKLGLTLKLNAPGGLVSSLDVDGVAALTDADLEYTLTIGSRKTASAAEKFGYVFFDNPHKRESRVFPATLEPDTCVVESKGNHATIRIGKMVAGPFAGTLELHLYGGSPLLHVQAAMAPTGDGIAYVYDAVVRAKPMKVAYEDLSGAIRKVGSGTPNVTPVAVRWRTIVGETDDATASVAVFPAPHAFFFPRDYTNNLKFAQVGNGRFGLRQDTTGGGAFVPWFDAPAGKTQRMDVFLLPAAGKAEDALAAVKRYTRDDALKPVDGHYTFTSHYHSRLAVGEMAGKEPGREFARVFKQMGIDIVHLSEFHGDGHYNDPGPLRLPEMKAMFDVCKKYSDDRLLLIPGEEGNKYLAEPWPPAPKIHPGHWNCIFPRNVYFTWVRPAGAPFSEEIPGYAKVYHVGDREDMLRLLREEKGRAWTAHPRIKASFATPDAFRDTPWHKEPLWLGAAWKAMPGNLADDRLGVRCLDLLDDMTNWSVAGGYPLKRMPGEVDVFELDRTHELYGHMNVNYLKMPKRPTLDDWGGVLAALDNGDFFTTTGEILIHRFDLANGKASADLEWTFPLKFAELITGDGKTTKRQRIELSKSKEYGREKFEWEQTDKSAKWVRLEVWDVARNGAFTQALPPPRGTGYQPVTQVSLTGW